MQGMVLLEMSTRMGGGTVITGVMLGVVGVEGEDAVLVAVEEVDTVDPIMMYRKTEATIMKHLFKSAVGLLSLLFSCMFQ